MNIHVCLNSFFGIGDVQKNLGKIHTTCIYVLYTVFYQAEL